MCSVLADEHTATVGQQDWPLPRCVRGQRCSELELWWGFPQALQDEPGHPLVSRALVPPELGTQGKEQRGLGNGQDDTGAGWLSQHGQDTGTTTKPRMKGKEEFYFHYLTNCRTPPSSTQAEAHKQGCRHCGSWATLEDH